MNLLLVDDEAFALEALEHAIDWKSLGIDQVFSCGNIRKAEQICEESDIQILICDIEMQMEPVWILHAGCQNIILIF